MSTIADWAEHPLPIEADAPVSEARRRFLSDSEADALAVVEGGVLKGVLPRELVLAADEGPATAERPVRELMALARCLDAGAPGAEGLATLLADGGCAEPVAVVRDGRYVGLITRGSLLRALQSRADGAAAQQDERRQFIHMLGREIRTPMSGVLAVGELLQRQPMTADAQAFVRTILDNSESVLRLLDDALDLALGETGRLEPRPQPVRLRALMDEIHAEWQAREAPGAAVLVAYDGEPELGVVADSERLRQVFANLIGSAMKTTRQGAVEASLRARATPQGVRLEGRVRDSGPGLPPEQLARIFEPSAHAPAGSRSGWGGLGPALCRRILEAMGGTIRAESNVGEGVTISFDLLVPRLDETATEEAGRSAEDRGPSVHVLVVDDNATNRMVAEGLCEMFDCTSETAEDGVEAVEAVRSGRFDLILMDIKMPRMDGMEATRQIRALPGPIGKTPIIALTANADPEDAKTYIACGMCAVVEKPIKPEKLLMAINAALDGTAPGEAVRAA